MKEITDITLANALNARFGGNHEPYALDTESRTFKTDDGGESFWHYEASDGAVDSLEEVSYEVYCDLLGETPDYGGDHDYDNWD